MEVKGRGGGGGGLISASPVPPPRGCDLSLALGPNSSSMTIAAAGQECVHRALMRINVPDNGVSPTSEPVWPSG